MKNLTFCQLQKDNAEHCQLFSTIFMEYIAQLRQTDSDLHKSDEFVAKWMNSIIQMQGPQDRHLELCFNGDQLVGFIYGKVDHEDHKGFIKPGFGYIMEFFVRPQFRRQGYGRAMFHKLEILFASDGASRIYLNADPVNGVPFWTAMGFTATKEISPENNRVIYEKEVIA